MEARSPEELVFKKYKRTTPGERLQWVRRYLSSGLTHREFCRQYGVGHNSLTEWQRELKRQQKQVADARQRELSEATPTLKELPLATVLGGGKWAGELSFPSGTILRLSPDMPAELLKEIIKGVIC